MADAIVLTEQQELYILCQLKELDHDDNGAARAVYFDVDLPFATDVECVVKLGCGVGGYNQNQAEIKTWLRYGDELPLARIVAYGKFVIVMERVSILPRYEHLESWDTESFIEDNADDMREYYEDYSDERRESLLSDMWYAACALDEIFDQTADNDQLGLDRNNRVVAYDYGFYADSNYPQTTELTYSYGDVQSYLETLIINYSSISLDENALLKIENDVYECYKADAGELFIDNDEENLDND